MHNDPIVKEVTMAASKMADRAERMLSDPDCSSDFLKGYTEALVTVLRALRDGCEIAIEEDINLIESIIKP